MITLKRNDDLDELVHVVPLVEL